MSKVKVLVMDISKEELESLGIELIKVESWISVEYPVYEEGINTLKESLSKNSTIRNIKILGKGRISKVSGKNIVYIHYEVQEIETFIEENPEKLMKIVTKVGGIIAKEPDGLRLYSAEKNYVEAIDAD